MKGIAIVTGASSGLGREFVRLLAGRQEVEQLWAVARDGGRLEELARAFGPKVRPVPLDLSRRESLDELEGLLRAEAPRVNWLVNSAGYAKFCLCRELSREESLNMIDLNAAAVVGVGLVCLPWMERGGHILNIASQAAFQPLPYLALYSATKAFVRNYSRALGAELREQGVTVTAVCPGWMDTALYGRARVGSAKSVTRFWGMAAPGPVAEKALGDALRGRDMSVYSLYVKAAHLTAKVLPQRAMMALWLRQQGL